MFAANFLRAHRLQTVGLWLAALLTLACFFYPCLDGQHLIYSGDFSGSDLLELNIPRRFLAAEALRQGELPLWSSYIGNGLPLLAEGQAAILYPLTLPLFLLLPLTWASNLSILLTLLIAMAGSYCWARYNGAKPRAAMLAALTFALSSSFIFRLKHLNLIEVISWLPWSMLLGQRLVCSLAAPSPSPAASSWRHRYLTGLGSALVLAIIWALQLLAGHPHATYICLVSTALLMLAQFLVELNSKRLVAPYGTFLSLLLLLITSGLAALALAAPQLLPTWELVQQSIRSSALTWEAVNAYPFTWQHLLRLWNPYCHGNPALGTFAPHFALNGVFWESTPFIGLVPLGLAIWAVCRKPGKTTLALALLGVIFLLLALGNRGGLYSLCYHLLPGFSLFRFPARFLIPFTAIAALLAALGLQKLEDILAESRFKPTLLSSLLIFLSWAQLFYVNSCYQSYLPSSCLATPPSRQYLQAQPKLGRVSSPASGQAWQALVYSQGWRRSIPTIVQHMQALSPDSSALFKVKQHSDHILHEGGIELLHHYLLQSRLEKQERLLPAAAPSAMPRLTITKEGLRLLQLQNVTHLVSYFPIVLTDNDKNNDSNENSKDNLRQQVESLTLLKQMPPFYLYAVSGALPYCRLVNTSLPATSPELALNLLQSDLVSWQSCAMVDGPALSSSSSSSRPPSAELLEQKNNSLTIRTNSDSAGYLVVAENYHPAWQAEVDGQPARLLRADLAFMAVPVGAGSHTVRLRFLPNFFFYGLAMAFICAIALLVIFLRLGKYWQRGAQ